MSEHGVQANCICGFGFTSTCPIHGDPNAITAVPQQYFTRTYTQVELEAAVNERVAIEVQVAADTAQKMAVAGYPPQDIYDQIINHIPPIAIDAQAKRDARVRLQEAKWWHDEVYCSGKCGDSTECNRLATLEAAAR